MRKKSILILLLSGAMIMNCFTATTANAKEEVIYADLNSSGDEKGAYIVNSFSDEQIVDYGNYSSVRNLSTMDKLNVQGDKISIDRKKNDNSKLYYEGKIDKNSIPWIISVKYILDGNEISPDKLAGKSGNLSIQIEIKENKDSKKGFFDNYALQGVIKLDENNCSDICASGATIASVGINKQLTYIMLPGEEKNITITAKVKDFEMDGMTFAGIHMSLGVVSDDIDTSELTDHIETMEDGITKIKNALNKLDSKSSKLTKGSKKINSALKKINSSVSDIELSTKKLDKLKKATKQIKAGTNQLVNGLKTAKEKIDTYYGALKKAGMSDINTYLGFHNTAINTIKLSETEQAYYGAYEKNGLEGVLKVKQSYIKQGKNDYITTAANKEMATVIKSLAGRVSAQKLLSSDCQYINGSNAIINGMNQTLDPSQKGLMSGAVGLQKGVNSYTNSIFKLISSIKKLSNGMEQLKAGISELKTSYGKFDSGLVSYTAAVGKISKAYNKFYNGSKKLTENSMLDKITNDNFKVTSFASDKNKNISSVQFAIKTEKIQKPEKKVKVVKKKKQTSLLDKFVNLFD